MLEGQPRPAARLSFLTLNCWGIAAPFFGSADRPTRIKAIANYLAGLLDVDVVCLQEVWSIDDFEQIKRDCFQTFPFSHRFASGVVGSGIVLLSKFRIIDLLTYRFSVNGYAHHVHRGDWYGGKVVGLARLHVPALESHINVYCTHVHAEYDRLRDVYLAHRVVQSLEICQFVRATCHAHDLAFLLGDLNLEACDLGYKIITHVTDFRDAWLDGDELPTIIPVDEGYDGCTADRPDNCYSRRGARPIRIDYVMFRRADGSRITVHLRQNEMHRLPDRPDLNFSDHVAVRVDFMIDKCPEIQYPVDVNRLKEAERCLQEARIVVQHGIDKSRYNRLFFAILAGCILSIFIGILLLAATNPQAVHLYLAMLVSFILAIIFGFYVWHGAVVLRSEENALSEANEEMDILCQTLKEDRRFYGDKP